MCQSIDRCQLVDSGEDVVRLCASLLYMRASARQLASQPAGLSAPGDGCRVCPPVAAPDGIGRGLFVPPRPQGDGVRDR